MINNMMTKRTSIWLLSLLGTGNVSVHAFQSLPLLTITSSVSQSDNTASILFAKVNKKGAKTKKQTATAGGFGTTTAPSGTKKSSSSSSSEREQDDYSAFPALEPEITQTLVPSTDADTVGEMATEIYERLAGIYGFRAFNYLSADDDDVDYNVDDDDSTLMSFQDLLTSGANDTTAAAPPNDFADLLKPALGGDLDTLLASATGSTDTAKTTTPTTTTTPTILPISKLAPFDKFQVLHLDPLVLSVKEFMTHEECDKYIAMSVAPLSPSTRDSAPLQIRSKTVGKDASAQAQRTSTTWFHHYAGVPELCAKAARLLGLDSIHQLEEPQTVRYRSSEKFTWHLDALGDPRALEQAGQRTATLLVYLTDMTAEEGGATVFRDLGGINNNVDNGSNNKSNPLRVRPEKGSALLFFPAAGGIPGKPLDVRTLHCGEAVAADSSADKWIAQLWVRESAYRVTAPPGNSHEGATPAIAAYCESERLRSRPPLTDAQIKLEEQQSCQDEPC